MDTRITSTGRARLMAVLAALALVGTAGCAAAKPAGGNVDVALQEWAVVPAQSSVSAGPVTFKVTNNGPDDPHEMVIIKTTLGPGDLPTNEFGKVDEEGAGLETIGEIEEFDPSKTETATFDLAAGSYVLICNILQDEPDGSKEAHYTMGMYIPFTVK
jgi:uncharacterized cupredoxin-like copper-binding protein